MSNISLEREYKYSLNLQSAPKPKILERIIEKDNCKEFSLYPPFPKKRFSIDLTNACNHSCLFCPHHGKMISNKGIMNEKLFYRIINDAFELGTREIGIGVRGEVFIVKKLAEYIKIVKDCGYSYVFINTNGALATSNQLQEVIESGLDSIRFSINAGTRESYKFIHGKDDFDIVKQNLLYCLDYRKNKSKNLTISVSFVVTTHTISEIEIFQKEFSHLADEIIFMRARNVGGYMPNAKELSKNCSDVPIMHERCIFPFNGIVISWEGYLTACCLDWQNYLAIADLNQMSLKEAWYGDGMKALRQRFIDSNFEGTICQLCKGKEYIEPQPLNKNLYHPYQFKD
jgi:MoaA/NifB/PqqE/SkfB family radical SAM enzyme